METGAIYPSPRAGRYTIGEMETGAISPPHGQVDKQLGRWKHAPYPLPTSWSIYNCGDGNTRHIPSPRAGQYTIVEMETRVISPPHEQVNIQLGRWEQAPYIPPTRWSIFNWEMGAGAIYPSPRAGQYTIGAMETGAISPPHKQVNIQLGRWKHAPYIPPTRWSIFNWEMGAGAIYPSPRAGQYTIGAMETGAISPPHGQVDKQLGRWKHAPYPLPTSWSIYNCGDGNTRHIPSPRAGQYTIGEMGAGAIYPSHALVNIQLGDGSRRHISLPTSWSIYNWGDGNRRHIPSPQAGQYTIGEMETRAIYPSHALVNIQLGDGSRRHISLPTSWSIYNWGDGNRRHIPSPRAGQYTIGEMGAGAIYPSHALVNIQLGDGSRRHISLPTSWSIYNWGDGNRRHIPSPRAGQYTIMAMGAGAIYPSPRAGQYTIGAMGAGAIYPSHEQVNIQLGEWEQAPYIPPTSWSIYNWGDGSRRHISLPTSWSIYNWGDGSRRHISLPRAGQYSIGRWEQAPYIPPHALVNKQLERWEQAPYIPPHELVNIQLGRWKHASYPLPTSWSIYNWGDGSRRHISLPRAGQYSIGRWEQAPYIPPHALVNKQLGRCEQGPYIPPKRWSIFNWGDVNRGHISLPRAGQYSIGEMGAGAIYPSPRAGQYSIGEMGAGAIYPSPRAGQ